MKLIDLLNCMNMIVTVSIMTIDNDVYVSCTKLENIPVDLVNLIKDRKVKDVFTINDIIKITIEE